MSESDIFVRIALHMTEFSEAMKRLRDVIERTAVRLEAILEQNRHRSGHRHRGTAGWHFRYAPARKDIPLGVRTLAKRRDLVRPGG